MKHQVLKIKFLQHALFCHACLWPQFVFCSYCVITDTVESIYLLKMGEKCFFVDGLTFCTEQNSIFSASIIYPTENVKKDLKRMCKPFPGSAAGLNYLKLQFINYHFN